MHKVILRMVDEEDGSLEAWGSEDEPVLDNRPSEYYETDIDVLIGAGMLTETDNGYAIASNAELIQLSRNSEIPSGVIGSVMGSVLGHNEVRWCGEPESGYDFTRNYLDAHSNLDHQSYETQDEYLESIEDYVNCGPG